MKRIVNGSRWIPVRQLAKRPAAWVVAVEGGRVVARYSRGAVWFEGVREFLREFAPSPKRRLRA